MDRPRTAAIDDFLQRVRDSKDKRAQVRVMVGAGEWSRADPDSERQREFLLRVYRERGAEALQGSTNDLQPIAFLVEGAAVSRAVGKLVVDTDTSHDEGTGFLISPDLFMTNQHVVRDAIAAGSAKVEFDFDPNYKDGKVAATSFALDPKKFALFSPEVGGLDYAVVGLGRRIGGDAEIESLGYCPLSNSPDRHVVGMSVNIIQHPGGQHKQISVRNNLLTHRTDRTLLYETDTKNGSSGSPVFNDDWDVVALHHYGEPFTERLGPNGEPFPIEVNEGIRISAIHADLAGRAEALEAPRRELLTKALALATNSQGLRLPQLERRPQPRDERYSQSLEDPMSSDNAPKDIRIAIPAGVGPVQVNMQIGAAVGAAAGKTLRSGQPPQLRSLAEGKRLDRDYSNRSGFDERFVQGIRVQLSKIVAPRKSRIAPLADGTASGELQYQNFSVIMDSKRRFAMITATNIDGDSYLAVDRKTGQADDGEGETWYKDRRIPEDAYVAQDFYSNWSHKFDRGHLTRRNDPTWGTAQEAERANADTFHFTNCSPQHFRFNQSTQFWQGVERYVLEKGLLQSGRAKRLTVLQGPVLSDSDDLWADDEVQIPAQFWKVVIWNGANGLRAVGMLVSQEELLSEDRTFIARPDEQTPIQVGQFHVGLKRIAKLAKIDLSDIEQYDTIEKGLPNAGEAVKPIRKLSDITL